MKREMLIPYEQGATAKRNGWERDSPYKNNSGEEYWLAGYDGIDFYEIQRMGSKPMSSTGISSLGLNDVR